jgi:hypothetical protein
MAEGDLADVARQVAAQRTQRAVRPPGGRKEGAISRWIDRQGSSLASQLGQIITHPEQMTPMPGNLGTVSPFVGMVKPPKPWVAQPAKSYQALGTNWQKEPLTQEERTLYDRYIAQDPQRFMQEYWGPTRTSPEGALYSAKMTGKNLDQPQIGFTTPLRNPETGESIGLADRTLYPGDRATHDLLEISEPWRGRGIGPDIFRRNIAPLPGLPTPINKVTAAASLEGGGSTWAKHGIRPYIQDYQQLIKKWIPERLNYAMQQGMITPEQHQMVNTLMKQFSNDPRGLYFLRSIADRIKGNVPNYLSGVPADPFTGSIGDYLLRGSSYRGMWNLNDPQQMEIIRREARPVKPWNEP